MQSDTELPAVVVIGAGGLGMAIARRMAQTNRVILADINGELAEEQAEQIRLDGGMVLGVQCDVTCIASVDNLRGVVSSAGGFRSVVHVAGLSIVADNFTDILRVNLLGPALIAQSLLPLATPGSSIILIASMAAHLTPISPAVCDILYDPTAPDLVERVAAALGSESANAAAAYALSKWGLLAYARNNVAEWGSRGGRIVSLSPGLIATPMGKTAYSKSPNKRGMLDQSPLGREGSMAEIADAVEFLTSERASFITGTDLLVDGGLSAVLKAPR